jgi:hypothetical protein
MATLTISEPSVKGDPARHVTQEPLPGGDQFLNVIESVFSGAQSAPDARYGGMSGHRAASAKVGALGANKVPAAGDDNQAMVNRESGAGSRLGEIVLNSASAISNDIMTLDDAVGVSISIDQSVNPTTGDKNKEVKALNDRAAQDTDNTSMTYATYSGNGRRLITVIVNNGYANSAGVPYPSNQQAIGLGYAQFLLLPTGSYTQNGGSNNPWAAVYVGPSPTTDTPQSGSAGNRGKGVGVVRLTN